MRCGVVCRLLRISSQYYGDCLWADSGARAVPNEGFLADGVVPPGVVSIDAMLAQVGWPRPAACVA